MKPAADALWALSTAALVLWLYIALSWVKRVTPAALEAMRIPSITCTEDLIRGARPGQP